MTALNGVAAEEKALRYFRRVCGVCVWLPAVHLEPGEVIVRSWPVVGQFHIARWPASISPQADAELLTALAKAWSAAGIVVSIPDDVAPWKYNKLLSNLGNAVGALSSDPADVSELVAAIRSEGENVLRHAGIEFVSFETSTAERKNGPTIRPVPGWNAGPSNSTWQSLSRNTGSVETDFLNGEIVRLANRHGITAPLTPRWRARHVKRPGAALGRGITRRLNSPNCWGRTQLTPSTSDASPDDQHVRCGGNDAPGCARRRS